MKISYPHTIENGIGEQIIFREVVQEPDGDRVLLENFIQPGHGPVMHTHFKQEEMLEVISGKLGYQLLGQEPKYAGPGESVLFKRGIAHRFWNAGDGVLNCKGWIKPVHSIVFFLTALYAAQNKSGKSEPESFDGAWLMTRYASEYDLPGIPVVVKKCIMPLTCLIGKLFGKYEKFSDAPPPLR
jgi:quercetin dioxygenase-like cupin family protein